MARVMIAGCGDIGAGVGRLLAVDGHEVAGVKRNPPADDHAIEYIKADLSSVEDLKHLDTNYDVVIYILSPGARNEEAYRKVFQYGVSNLLSKFSQSRSTARFIFVSSTSVYGQCHGEWVDEESSTQPTAMNGQLVLQAEQAFIAHDRRNCIIRFSGIYGRGRSRLIDMVSSGGEVQYRPSYYTNRIHRDDCVAVLHFIAHRMIAGAELEPIYLATDDDPAPKWEVFSYIADRLGVAAPEKAILPEDSDQNKRCSNRRLRQLGYNFIYKSYREGYANPARDI